MTIIDEIKERKEQVLAGLPVTKDQAMEIADRELSQRELEELCAAARDIQTHFCENGFDLCSIINGKSGRCTENCVYCAQSAHFPAHIDSYSLLSADTITARALSDERRGVQRFSVVTSGRALSHEELEAVSQAYGEITAKSSISCCASHGLLDYQQLLRLRQAGVTRYHCNLETSRRNFPNICTTHSYEEKLDTLENARKAGLELCSGGIIGLGETMEDRIDLALELRRLEVKSIPINVLTPIAGTPLEHLPVSTPQEVLKTVAIFRFLLPDAVLRMAGGRGLLPDKGYGAFQAGANAAITGDMLTTSGITVETDLDMVENLGYKVCKIPG